MPQDAAHIHLSRGSRYPYSLAQSVVGLSAVPLALGACDAARLTHHEPVSTPRYHIAYVGEAQRIVSVNPRGGPAFSIFGRRYRFGGQNYVELQSRFAAPWRIGVQSAGAWGGESSSLTDDQGIEVIQGCQVHPIRRDLRTARQQERQVVCRDPEREAPAV